MGIGNRVFLKRELPDKELMEQFKELPAANVADCMGRLSALSSDIKLISSPKAPIMVGPALTVKVPAGDNLFLHKALDMAQEGDVIVVANKGTNTQAIMGEIMVSYGRYAKKIAGLVLDGPIRDIDALSKIDFPLYATGSTPGGPFKEGTGEVNTPIAIGDVTVCPGDIILADADGVIVIPKHDAAALLEKAKEYSKFDQSKLEAAKNGTAKRGWVDETLAKKNVEIIDDVFKY